MDPFLQLDDLLLRPPLGALVAVLFPLALLGLGDGLAARLAAPRRASALEVAGGFVLITGVVAAAAYVLALAGLATLPVLRSLGAVVGLVGLVRLPHLARTRLAPSFTASRELWHEASAVERWALAATAATVGGLTLAALGPATEVDSLDYHLGVPLDWLRHGAAVARPDWLHARFVGVGDGLNLLGLALGTDALGAAFQAAGLLVALVACGACADGSRDRIFVFSLVAGCLVVITAVASQKPMLLPAAATTTALVAFVRRFRTIDRATLFVGFGCAAFAVGCKYSFLFSGAVVCAVGLLAAWRAARGPAAVGLAVAALLALAAPLYVGNLRLYGNPLWPFLGSDPLDEGFAWYLRNFGLWEPSLRRLLLLPVQLVVPFDPARIGKALGVGALGILLAWRDPRASRGLLACAVLVAGSVLLFGQLTSRFLLEPYLWCAAAVASTSWRAGKRLLALALTGQVTAMAALAAYAALTLFPGAWSPQLRQRVMQRAAPGSAVCDWMDRTLPPDVVIASTVRAHALYPRPFVAADLARFLAYAPMEEDEKRERLLGALDARGVDVVVTRLPVERNAYARIRDRLGPPLGPPGEFVGATRNPLGRGGRYRVQAFRLRPAEDSSGAP